MTAIKRRRWLALTIAAGLGGLTVKTGFAKEDQTMATSNFNLWQAVKSLENHMPFSREKVEQVLGGLKPLQQEGDDPFLFFEGGPIALNDGNMLSKIDLRLKKTEGLPSSFLVLKLGEACVTLQQVKEHYADLRLTQLPRGRSLDEEASYSARRKWGKLSFGFKAKRPECLSSIAFDPLK